MAARAEKAVGRRGLRENYVQLLRPGVQVLDPKGKELITVGDAWYEVNALGVLTVSARDYSMGAGSSERRSIPIFCAAPGQWGRIEIVELQPPAPKPEAKPS